MSILKVPYFALESDEFSVPTVAYSDDAGYDLFSAETITILPRSFHGGTLEKLSLVQV